MSLNGLNIIIIYGKAAIGLNSASLTPLSEALFKVGMCLPAGPCVTDEDVRYIVDTIKGAIVG